MSELVAEYPCDCGHEYQIRLDGGGKYLEMALYHRGHRLSRFAMESAMWVGAEVCATFLLRNGAKQLDELKDLGAMTAISGCALRWSEDYEL